MSAYAIDASRDTQLPSVADATDTVRDADLDQLAAPSDSATSEIRFGLIIIAIFFGLFLGWFSMAPLSAAVSAPGVVVVSGNRQTVQHRDGGVVTRLVVREGQRVKTGQVLIELGAPEIVGQERSLFSQLIDLHMQRALLQAELAGARRLERPLEWSAFTSEDDLAAVDAAYARYARRLSSGQRVTSQFGARIQGHREELAALDRQEAALRAELDSVRQLAQEQLAPLSRVRELERGLAQLQGRRAELRASIATTDQGRGEELRRIEARLAEVAPQFYAARARLEQTRIRAPTAGAVVGLNIHTVGGVIRPGERVMDIVPEGQDLIVEAKVRPEDADDLHAGMATEVRVTAFSGRDMPILNGRVQQVSADRLLDERTGQGYFAVQVAVSAKELAQLREAGANRHLRAGLPAEIVVPTRERTALQYLIEPLSQSFWHSFREN